MASYIFLDVETTGLDTNVDQITEIAWIIPTAPRDLTEHHYVRHDRLPNEWVLKESDYLTRILPSTHKVRPEFAIGRLVTAFSFLRKPTYLVAANPSFDDRMLRRHGLANPPYHYHLIDVEVMAMGILGLSEPPKLSELPALLRVEENSAPHTALEDARTVKRCFDQLREHQRYNLDMLTEHFRKVKERLHS